MNWFVGAILILLLALIGGFGLLAYAMYALLGRVAGQPLSDAGVGREPVGRAGMQPVDGRAG